MRAPPPGLGVEDGARYARFLAAEAAHAALTNTATAQYFVIPNRKVKVSAVTSPAVTGLVSSAVTGLGGVPKSALAAAVPNRRAVAASAADPCGSAAELQISAAVQVVPTGGSGSYVGAIPAKAGAGPAAAGTEAGRTTAAGEAEAELAAGAGDPPPPRPRLDAIIAARVAGGLRDRLGGVLIQKHAFLS